MKSNRSSLDPLHFVEMFWHAATGGKSLNNVFRQLRKTGMVLTGGSCINIGLSPLDGNLGENT